MRYDAIIVGGGPAGLSAALVLARCRRRVVVVDAGRGRNFAAAGIHNFVTRDGIGPGRFVELARREVRGYGARIVRGTVAGARRVRGGFAVTVGGRALSSRTLLLATGVVDVLPDVPGMTGLYGRGVHHCPYCDAWGYRGRPMAAYGGAREALGLAMCLLTWSRRVTAVTNGKRVPRALAERARRLGLSVRAQRIARIERDGARGVRVVFASGPALRVAGLFFNTGMVQRSGLPARLGCTMGPDGGVLTTRKQGTGVPGLYLAGDASFDVQFVVVAAAEGAKAGVAMNRQLQDWDRGAELGEKR